MIRPIATILLAIGFSGPWGTGISHAAEESPVPADAPLPEEPRDVPTPLLDDAEFKGNLFYFQRDRDRYDVTTRQYRTNLHHSTMQASLEFNSGFIAKTAGFDFGIYGTKDVENSGAPDHEISFFPWDNPWSPDWSKTDSKSGFSVYKAHLKLKHDESWAKLGLFQPSGPGVLGVNWSLMPGTYTGAEAGSTIGPVTFAAAWANRYKAPWFRESYHFRQNDGTTDVSYLWSLGVRYAVTPTLSAELAYGESAHYLKNAHLKIKHTSHIDGKHPLYLTYQLYAMGDSNDGASVNNNFAGTALQHYLAANYSPAPWALKAEFLHTRAPANRPENAGYFAYRLIGAYGGANGAYEPWWDNRSDWDHHKESAVFLRVARSLDDLTGTPGWTAAVSKVYGWGGKAYGFDQTLKESSYALDLGYKFPGGKLKDASINLHYTHYNNKTDLPSWVGFKNAFQDERDVKFIVILPWTL